MIGSRFNGASGVAIPLKCSGAARPFKHFGRMNTEQGRAGAEMVARYVRSTLQPISSNIGPGPSRCFYRNPMISETRFRESSLYRNNERPCFRTSLQPHDTRKHL